MEEKWKQSYCFEVYSDGEYSIYLKSRCNVHPGEPTMKVWVCQYGREIAQFTDKYRGYGRFSAGKHTLPDNIVHEAENTWQKLRDGVYTEEKLNQLREAFIEKYEAREKRALAALAQTK
ncbi:hypothetical protein IJ768_03435 [Candidatus Saccharibacteria bacterium]|nr:hypothetical protein [Candidatus Saccharibacteria bacterium]